MDQDWLLTLWVVFRLMSEGLGPVREWDPVPDYAFRHRHNEFWTLVSGSIIPDDEDDEPFWMTNDASLKLANN
jgi:hypothetical protein